MLSILCVECLTCWVFNIFQDFMSYQFTPSGSANCTSDVTVTW